MTTVTIDQAVEMARAHWLAGRCADAEALCRHILAHAPQHLPAWHYLAMALSGLGRTDDALAAFRQALRLDPNAVVTRHNLGNLLQQLGRVPEAIAEFQTVLRLAPHLPETHTSLGAAKELLGDLTGALDCWQHAVKLRPEYPEAWGNICAANLKLGRLGEAIAAGEKAVALTDPSAVAPRGLGENAPRMERIKSAFAGKSDPGAANPRSADAHNNLGVALQEAGRQKDASDHFLRAVELWPGHERAKCNLLLNLNFWRDLPPEEICAAHRAWGKPFDSMPILPHHRPRDPDRRLKIGYVSADFWRHAVATFMEGPLRHHDRRRFEIYCYVANANVDEMTQRLRALEVVWRPIVGLNDDQAAALIRQDGIDILVDLAGHTSNNRLGIFARKPAPLQATYLGYPNTTGLATIDHRITDGYSDPPGMTETHYIEKLVRLENNGQKTGFNCYTAPWDAPNVTPLPAGESGPITFGSFNRLSKYTEEIVRLWARVVKQVEHSRLLLKAPGLADHTARAWVMQILSQAGIGPDRVDLRGVERDIAGHLGVYGQLDLALDTYPYHGTTTTCEALWMGVPVVTLAGRTHVSRTGVSVLSAAGLPELIALNEDEYVRIAAGLATNRPHLARLRATMRDRLLHSPLMNAPGFTRALEQVYREIWRRRCDEDVE